MSRSERLAIPNGAGGTFDAYLALPEGDSAPAIIVVSSIFGVTAGLRRTMDRYAQRGYIAIAPDFFWRTVPGPMDDAPQAEAEVRVRGYNIENGLEDMVRTRDYLASRSGWNGKFAVLGFCFGGRHAFLGLTRLGADAAAAFHGSHIHRYLDEAEAVTKPFSFHFAAIDPLVPLDSVDAIRTALAGKPGDIEVYDGVHHGYAREESPRYDPEAARLSEERAFARFETMISAPTQLTLRTSLGVAPKATI